MINGNFTVRYPSRSNVDINGALELRRCQITACSPENAHDIILKLEDKEDELLVTNVSEMPLFSTITVKSSNFRKIPHDSMDTFEILSTQSSYSKMSMNVKVEFEAGYMFIKNDSSFDISIRHTIGSQGMYLRKDDYVTLGDDIQVLQVVKDGKIEFEWDACWM